MQRVDWYGDVEAYLGGSTEPWAVSVLQALVRVKRPRRILELGTYEGLTTRALRAAAPHAAIWTVDLEKRWSGEMPASFIESDAEAFLRATDLRFDFVFVDDDHDASHVREELDLLLKRRIVAPGGLIVGHDVRGPFNLAPLFETRGGFIIELPLLHAAGALGVIEIR